MDRPASHSLDHAQQYPQQQYPQQQQQEDGAAHAVHYQERLRVGSASSKESAPVNAYRRKRNGVNYANFDDNAAVGDYDMKKSASTAAFVHEMIEDRFLSKARQSLKLQNVQEERIGVAATLLGSSAQCVLEGFDALGEDEFWKCFEKSKVENWNWNLLLFTMWSLGVVFRYCVLFPVRVLILLCGWILFFGGMLLVQLLAKARVVGKATKIKVNKAMISWMSSCFVLTWSGVIRYHGRIPKTETGKTNIVFVANHTSLIDVIVLQQVKLFSLVGQKHKGLVRFLQEEVLGCLQCIWFDRGEMRDRTVVSKKLSEHAKDPTRNPLLVFPEGTCVNNEHVLQFKKGVFELGVPIVPICIKYNKLLVDPFWSSRDQSFAGHLVELMTSWCLICDVYFLEPTVRRDGDSAEDFALRVRNTIAAKGGMKAVDWDGYLKHFQPSERLLNQRKQLYADGFKKLLEDLVEKRLQGLEDNMPDDDFYIGAPSPSINSETSDSEAPQLTSKTVASGRSGSRAFPAVPLGPAALTNVQNRKAT